MSNLPEPDPAPISRPRNRRGEGDRLRDEIVSAAAELLEETGSEDAVTLRAVARHVGIAAPSIYGHFADRAAMHEAVRAATFKELEVRLNEAILPIPTDDPVTRLGAGCRAYLRFAAERPQRYRFLFGPTMAASPPSANDDVAYESGLEAFQILVDGVAACADQGHSSSTDPFADAANLWVALHGLALLRSCAPAFPWPDREAQIDDLIAALGRLRPRKLFPTDP